MKSYGQFCSIARALDLLGERWTLLVVRELLSGSTRFGEVRRGIPRISRTMLSARLRELLDAGVIARDTDSQEGTYTLTPSGLELAETIQALGTWGQRWLPRDLTPDELDTDALVWDMRRRVNLEALPKAPVVVRIEASIGRGRSTERFLLLRRTEVSLCTANPGFPVELDVRGTLSTLTAWWRGDLTLSEARSLGMTVDGKRQWTRAFPKWFERYAFAEVAPAHSKVRST